MSVPQFGRAVSSRCFYCDQQTAGTDDTIDCNYPTCQREAHRKCHEVLNARENIRPVIGARSVFFFNCQHCRHFYCSSHIKYPDHRGFSQLNADSLTFTRVHSLYCGEMSYTGGELKFDSLPVRVDEDLQWILDYSEEKMQPTPLQLLTQLVAVLPQRPPTRVKLSLPHQEALIHYVEEFVEEVTQLFNWQTSALFSEFLPEFLLGMPQYNYQQRQILSAKCRGVAYFLAALILFQQLSYSEALIWGRALTSSMDQQESLRIGQATYTQLKCEDDERQAAGQQLVRFIMESQLQGDRLLGHCDGWEVEQTESGFNFDFSSRKLRFPVFFVQRGQYDYFAVLITDADAFIVRPTELIATLEGLEGGTTLDGEDYQRLLISHPRYFFNHYIDTHQAWEEVERLRVLCRWGEDKNSCFMLPLVWQFLSPVAQFDKHLPSAIMVALGGVASFQARSFHREFYYRLNHVLRIQEGPDWQLPLQHDYPDPVTIYHGDHVNSMESVSSLDQLLHAFFIRNDEELRIEIDEAPRGMKDLMIEED